MNPKLGDSICPECKGLSNSTTYYFPCHKCKNLGYINWLKEFTGGNEKNIYYKFRLCYDLYKKILKDRNKIIILSNHTELTNYLFRIIIGSFYEPHNTNIELYFPWNMNYYGNGFKTIFDFAYGIAIVVNEKNINSYIVKKKSFIALKNKNKNYENTQCNFLN